MRSIDCNSYNDDYDNTAKYSCPRLLDEEYQNTCQQQRKFRLPYERLVAIFSNPR